MTRNVTVIWCSSTAWYAFTSKTGHTTSKAPLFVAVALSSLVKVIVLSTFVTLPSMRRVYRVALPSMTKVDITTWQVDAAGTRPLDGNWSVSLLQSCTEEHRVLLRFYSMVRSTTVGIVLFTSRTSPTLICCLSVSRFSVGSANRWVCCWYVVWVGVE